ncbi:MAG: hypothetical protein ACYC4L_19285 [Chloroflexota bacterium]
MQTVDSYLRVIEGMKRPAGKEGSPRNGRAGNLQVISFNEARRNRPAPRPRARILFFPLSGRRGDYNPGPSVA